MGNNNTKTKSVNEVTTEPTSIHESRKSFTHMSHMNDIKSIDIVFNQSTFSLRSSRVLSSIETPISASSPQTSLPSDNKNTKMKSVPIRRRRSSLLNVQNGITGKFISSRICKIAAIFWQENVENISLAQQLEVGCTIFFGIFSDKQMKPILNTNFKQNIETTSLRFLDMMGWLIRHLATDNIDLYTLLIKLGVFHSRMNLKINHYNIMLQSLHATFSHYFPT
eukprot:775376_1